MINAFQRVKGKRVKMEKKIKCDICGKMHTTVNTKKIRIDGKVLEVEVIKSPCLAKISKQAVELVNNIFQRVNCKGNMKGGEK